MQYPLLSRRLRIEPLTANDLNSFLSYRQDPEIAKFQSWEPSYSRKDALELISSQSGVLMPESGAWIQLALHSLKEGKLVGDLALHAVSGGDAVYEIGFTISRTYQRQGYALEGAARLLEFLFREKGARKIIATCDSRNTAASLLLRGLGFEQVASKSWDEEFKNELVTVDFFEIKNTLPGARG